MPVGPASSPSGVFLLSEAFSFEKAPEQVPSELPKVSETFLICPLMLGPNITSVNTVENEIGGWSSSDSNLSRGALYTTRANQGPRHQSSYRTGWYHMISLDASRSSSSFGRSTSVQPPSARLLVLIKT